MSRACLGKMTIFIYKRTKRSRFNRSIFRRMSRGVCPEPVLATDCVFNTNQSRCLVALDKDEFSHPFGRTMNSSPAREKIETHPSKQLRHVLQYLTVMMRKAVGLFSAFFQSVPNLSWQTYLFRVESWCVFKVPFEPMHDHLRDHFEHIQRAKAQLHYFPP